MLRAAPTQIEIDLNALRHNYRILKKRLGEGVRALCVVKSNAYGHGAVPVARTLQSLRADSFGVGTVDEGIQLRAAGIKRPILILLGIIDGKFAELVRYQLTPVLYDLETARSLHRFLSAKQETLDVHIKIDTGMTRLGLLPEEATRFFGELKKFDSLWPVGLMTHLADADEPGFSNRQVKIFEKVCLEFRKHFGQPGLKIFRHISNSLASIDRRHLYDSVRLGIALYGAYPVPRQKRLLSLQPVMHWKSRIIAVKKVPKGTWVSYGRTFLTKRPSRIGVVPVGYADGYPRLASNRGELLVGGKRAPVVGRVCMDMLMVDLTKIPAARVEDEVVLLGRQGRECISAEELGGWAETISYEIFCQIAERVPRHYLDPNRA